MGNIIKNIFNNHLYAMSLYARQIAGTFVLLLVVRFLSVYDYGLFASYNQIAATCLMIANLGYAEYILVSSQKNVRDVQLKIGLFIGFAVVVLLSILCISGFVNLESRLIFALVAIRSFFDLTFLGLMLPYYQASERFDLISYINIFYSVMTILFALICYIFNLGLIQFLLLGIALGIFNFIQCTYYAKINYILVLKHLKEFIKKIDKSILIYAGSSLVFFFYNKIPSVYVATFIQKEEAALFFAAFTISNIISILLQAQYQKMIPEMIKAPVSIIKKIIKNNLIFMMTINFILLIIFALIGEQILIILYSKEFYMKALPYLLLLTLGNIFISFASVFGAFMTASGYQNLKLKIMSIASVVTLLSLFVFHKLGLFAAVISFVISASFMAITYCINGIKILHRKQEEENND